MPGTGNMRAVIDTNVLLSGLLWRGTPHQLMEAGRAGTIALVTSPALLSERDAVIRRPKFHAILARSRIDPDWTLGELRRLAEIVTPPALPDQVSRDPDDDAVLALAVAARADIIISGDADLLALGVHAGIPIVGPAAAIAGLGG